MNVPWIFFKKNPNNILKNCPALEFQQSKKTFQRIRAWLRWTRLGLLLKSRKDFEELSSKEEISPWAKLREWWKMNVPWIFLKKNPKNILKNYPALEFQQSTKTFQRTRAWRRWTCLGLLLKSRKDFEELSSSRVREITMSKITWNDKGKCALPFC